MSASSSCSTEVSAKQERILLPLPRWDEDFVDCHFPSVVFERSDELDTSLSYLISAIKSAAFKAGTYVPTARLLNRLSETAYHLAHGDCDLKITTADPESSMASPPALLFSPSPRKPPAHDIFKVSVKPDILAIFSTLEGLRQAINSSEATLEDARHKGSLSEASPSWSLVESAVESKPNRVGAKLQVNQYADTLLRYRPDKTKAVCLTSNQSGYVFYVSEPCGVHCSRTYDWDEDMTDLFRFVYLFYLPTHDSHDPTFSRAELRQKRYWQWHVSLGDTTYDVSPVLSRKGVGRRTWLGIGTVLGSEPPAFRIVKDMWRDDRRRFEEGVILKRIHANGCIPGVVRLVTSGLVNGLTAGVAPHTRTKYRLVMGSSGSRLSACTSVLQFLKVMYDALEAHQHLVEQGILHRDMSWYNVLCNPCHHVDHPDGKEPVSRTCIAKIMGEDNPQSRCLITDFDNSALLDETSSCNELTQRTGTPMFIAADISGGRDGYEAIIPRPISRTQFQLIEDDRKLYIRAYGEETYESFNTFLDSVIDGSIWECDPFENADGPGTILHQPFHDVESVFWIITWFLMHAWPTGHDPALTEEFGKATKAMLAHQIDNDDYGGRKDLLTKPARKWSNIIHPECCGLVKMLVDMAAYVSMRWMRFPTAPTFHAHEAFKRLLLKEIVRMTRDGRPIPIQGARGLPPHSVLSSSPVASATKNSKSVTPSAFSFETALETLPSGSGHRKRSRSCSPGPMPNKKSKLRSDKPRPGCSEAEQWLRLFVEDKGWFQ
ncbi:hypothetical protein K439DRAFT_1662505 [Ramaria rubella]|nr:hypothetical protein K439DRAFT_1662505 [Ramaria rubella]